MAPLDWGLGHATRCIPIVKVLLANGYTVVLAAEGEQKVLLEKEFPQLLMLPLKGYGIRYSKTRALLPVKILQQIPKILAAIKYEQLWLDKVIKEHQIDLVISDNRYGLHHPAIPCVFITHQLTIKTPMAWLENVLQRINYKYINQFTACWVPDVAGEVNLAGVLAHPKKMPSIPVHYIGLLSRFQLSTSKQLTQRRATIILSGPEPQRSLLEAKICSTLLQTDEQLFLVRGKPSSNETLSLPNTIVHNHLAGDELVTEILRSEFIICRSGYTSLMELLTLQKKTILIPTPGQTEQEYLAEKLMQQGWCYTVSQKDFDLTTALQAAQAFSYSFPSFVNTNLNTVIPQLMKALQQ